MKKQKLNTTVNEDYKDVLKDAVLIAVEVHQWGNTKKIPPEKLRKITGKKLSKWVHTNKGLIDKEALTEINSRISAFRNIFKAYSLPFPITAIHLIPLPLLEECCEKADVAIDDILEARESFASEYQDYIKLAKEELGEELFDPNDYPDEIKNRFSASYRIIKLEVPGELAKVNPALYKAEMQKFKQTMIDTKSECILFLREAFLKELKAVIASLTGETEDGESKRIRSETTEKMEKFFEYFQTMDIFKDEEFFKIIKDTKNIMVGITSKDLRESDKLREMITKEMQKVAKVAEENIVELKRSIIL
jgi:hypothetical protein